LAKGKTSRQTGLQSLSTKSSKRSVASLEVVIQCESDARLDTTTRTIPVLFFWKLILL